MTRRFASLAKSDPAEREKMGEVELNGRFLMEMRDCVGLTNNLLETQGQTVPYIPFLKTAATTLFVRMYRVRAGTDVPHLGEGNKGGGEYSISSLQLRHGIMGRERVVVGRRSEDS